MADGYIDAALAAGIPIEAIDRFLAANPQDYHRIMLALAGPREQLQGRGLTNEQIAQTLAATRPDLYGPAMPGGGNLPPRAATADRETIASVPTSNFGFHGWADVVGDVIGQIPGIPEPWRDIISQVPGLIAGPPGGAPGLPMPPPRPQLPGRTQPPTTINVPTRAPRGGISARKAAAIAAAAAALGLTVEQYLQLYPNALRSGRRINPLNPKALRRSLRRLDGFEKFVRRTYRVPQGAQFRGKKYKRGRRK